MPVPVAAPEPLVRDYMARNVLSISADDSLEDARKAILSSLHHGLPVIAERNRLIGFLTAKELLRHMGRKGATVQDILAKGTVVAQHDMKLQDAARVMFREGLKVLPVIDGRGTLVGILSTTDVLRSHIERSDERKVKMFRRILEEKYGVAVRVRKMDVLIRKLRPTQKRIHRDELEGRRHEIEKGLAEPIIVIRKKNYYVLVDGHHRVVAARAMGLESLVAHVLEISDTSVELGLEKSARDSGLRTLDDIEILETDQHPLVEVTHRLLARERSGKVVGFYHKSYGDPEPAPGGDE